MVILICSAVRSPSRRQYSFLMCWMIALSSSSPATRIDCAVTMPPSEMTATSVVPPPMSTTMLPVASWTGQPGADRGGHRLLDDVHLARARPACDASMTARRSTPVMPEGTQTTTRGRAR